MADVLQSQGLFVDAEGILLEAHAHVHATAFTTSALGRDTIEHLAQFYGSWTGTIPGAYQAAKALEWEERLAECDTARNEVAAFQ